MEQLIQQADFMHTDNDDLQSQFSESLSDWDSESVSFAQWQASLRAAQSKICHPDFPSEGSSGYYMGNHLLAFLIDCAKDLVSGGKADVTSVNNLYLEFILHMIKVGPQSSHVKYIKRLMNRELEEFYQSLGGDQLKAIVLSLKKEFTADPGMDPEDYFSHHLDSFWRCFIFDGLSEEQFAEMQHEFIELYTFFNNSFNDRDRVIWKAMRDVAYRIDRKYDSNIFQGFDVSEFRQQLSTISRQILAPRFPQSEEIGKEIKDDLSQLLKAVSDQGLVVKLYGDIMDLALSLTVSKAGCQDTLPHFEAIGYFFYHLKEESVKDNTELFEGLMSKYLHFLSHVEDEVYLTVRFVMPVMYDCLNKAMGKSEKHVGLWLDMVKALLKHSIPDCVATAERAIREQEKVLKWKKYPEDIKKIFALLSAITYPKWLTEKQREEGDRTLEDLTKSILEEAKKVGIVKLGLTEPMVRFAFHCLEGGTEASYSLAEILADRVEFNPKQDKSLMMEAIQRVTTYVEDDSYDWEDEKIRHLGYTLRDLVHSCISCVKDGRMFTWDEYDELIYLSKLCQKKMLAMSEAGTSIFFNIFIIIGSNITNWLQTMNEEHRLIPLVPSLVSLLDSDEENILSTATTLINSLSHKAGAMFARYNQKLVDKFLEDENDSVLWALCNSYEYNRDPVEKRFDELFEHIDSGNMSVRSYILQLLAKVAKLQPHLFTQDRVGVVVKEAKEDSTQQVVLLMLLGDVAKRHMDHVEPWIDDFMTPDLWQPLSAHSRLTILQLYAIASEEKADKVISYLVKRIQTSDDYTEVLVALNACRLIGFKHRPAIDKQRGTIEHFKASTSNTDYHAGCTAILDMLDGKSVDKITEELRELQGEVADLDLRVTGVENDLGEVKDAVHEQGEEVEGLKKDVGQQGQQLSQIQDSVQDTAAKLQEVDAKTLSHAPYWARDVSRLLNVEAEADWRLLSLRLGFTNDDIRAWAMTSDPCMSMLNEWYATHKTREATHAVLTSLQLLDREDAAAIVENAMKNAEAVVEDEDFQYPNPPDVFLSYQWGHQDHIKLLCQHLHKAGFTCWMDVGQMGGGDKLFEKIDSGIRGAKVVISCVTAKYARSPNCNREVNLAVSLNKPVIPLLMEQTMWPPPGSLGPLFSELLFIRFFQRSGEHSPDQRYWPLPKFQELLMQLSFHRVLPDQPSVQPEYKDWWVPKVEEITIDKDHSTNNKSAVPSATPSGADEMAQSPEVFISYQWGKQPQILKLYARLTSLGYRCWLDIMQMGGGDSLYDKIDRGLRGCRVVLSCITAKYAKSPNCRREVSLADALQKPLIPVLLEKGEWPPPGPMSPVLTQLLYVDCTSPSLQDSWLGPHFQQLLATIDRHAPPATHTQEGEGEEKGEDQEKGEKEGDKGVGGEGEKEGEKGPESAPQPTSGVPVAAAAPPPAASAPKRPGEEERDQGERTKYSEETNAAAPQQKADSDRQDADREQDYAKPAPQARKTSVNSSADSMVGHDVYDQGNQLAQAGLGDMRHANEKTTCCIIQ